MTETTLVGGWTTAKLPMWVRVVLVLVLVSWLFGSDSKKTESTREASRSSPYSSYCSKPYYDPDYIWGSCATDSPRHRRNREVVKDVWDDVTGK